MKKSETLEAVTTLFSLLSQGNTIDEASEVMGIDPYDIEKIKKKLFEIKTEELQRQPIEHVYVEYMLQQSANLADLTKIINDYNNRDCVDTKQTSAVVGAIRARSEITDKVLLRGQDCGVIKKAPERRENIHGVFVADLTSKELRQKIIQQYSSLSRMTKNIEDEDIINLPVLDELHYGDRVDVELKKETEEEEEEKIQKKKKKKKKKKKNPRKIK